MWHVRRNWSFYHDCERVIAYSVLLSRKPGICERHSGPFSTLKEKKFMFPRQNIWTSFNKTNIQGRGNMLLTLFFAFFCGFSTYGGLFHLIQGYSKVLWFSWKRSRATALGLKSGAMWALGRYSSEAGVGLVAGLLHGSVNGEVLEENCGKRNSKEPTVFKLLLFFFNFWGLGKVSKCKKNSSSTDRSRQTGSAQKLRKWEEAQASLQGSYLKLPFSLGTWICIAENGYSRLRKLGE